MTRTTATTIGLIFVLLISLGLFVQSPGRAQSQQVSPPADQKRDPKEEEQVIELSSRLVNVLFSATNKNHLLITDITKDEIEVYENDHRQEIFEFSRVIDLPLTIVLLIDVSGSEQYTLPAEKHAAGVFLRSIVRPPKDVVAIAQFRDEVLLAQDFTSTLERLERGLERVRYIPPTTTDNTSKFGGTSLYDAIYIACRDLLARQAGRRTIILLTDGEDTTSFHRLPDAIDRAYRSEVTVYSIGIGDPRFGINRSVLNKLSQETGGRAYFPKRPDDLVDVFREIEVELRNQYLVAYSPSNQAMDGTFRAIEIRVPRRKDLRVRHRHGYYAPQSKPLP